MLSFLPTLYTHRCALGMMLALLLLPSVGAAQEPVYIGLAAGYEFGVPLTFDRRPGIINRYGFDGAGISESQSIGGGLYLGTPSLYEWGLGASFRLTYRATTDQYLSDIFSGDTLFDLAASNGYAVPFYRLELGSRVQSVEAEIATSHLFPGGITLEPGLWGSYRAHSQFTRTLRQQLFVGGESEVDVEREEGEQLGSQAFRFGAALRAGVQIPLFQQVLLRPELTLRFDATAAGSVDLLQMFSPGASLSLLYNISSRGNDTPPFPPFADTVPRADALPPDRTPRLDAHVDLFSIDESGERSQASATRLVSVLWEQHMPFPGTIFFDSGSADIPDRYRRLSPEQASGFSLDNLAGLGPKDLYLHALNLLGLRMREHPKATVTLVGIYAANEPSTLGRLRANAVRAYLLEIWGVDGARVGVRSNTRGNAIAHDESRSVRVETAGEIDDPVGIEWQARSYAPLAIDLEPEIEAEAGVQFWSITIRQGERVLTQYSNREEDSTTAASLALHIPDNREDADVPPLVAELLVEDSTGRRRVVADTLPVLRSQTAVADADLAGERGRRARRVYLVPWADHRQWGGRSGPDWLHDIAKRAGAGARITIGVSSAASAAVCEEMGVRLRTMTAADVTVATIEHSTIPAGSAAPVSPEERRIESLVRVDVEIPEEAGNAGRP